MEIGKVYSFIDLIENTALILNLFTYFEIILAIASMEGPQWHIFRTRSGVRFVNAITIHNGNLIIPDSLMDIHDQLYEIVIELFKLARKTIKDNSEFIPIQVYICYYRDGKDVCPMHSHKCRQLTLSIGSDRKMTIDKSKHNLYNGSIVYLHRNKHGILKEDPNVKNRISINLFYTTSFELDGVN